MGRPSASHTMSATEHFHCKGQTRPGHGAAVANRPCIALALAPTVAEVVVNSPIRQGD